MSGLAHLHETLDVLVALVNLVGVPIAIGVFVVAKRRERLDRETGTYATLNQQYLDFLRMAFDHPELPIYGADVRLSKQTPEQERKIECAFLTLISLIENAYLLYRQHGSKIRRAQWSGWQDYILDYFRNPYFSALWPVLSPQFDTGFTTAINTLVAREKAKIVTTTATAPCFTSPQ